MRSRPVSIHYFDYRYQGKIGKLPANTARELQIRIGRAGKKREETILVQDTVRNETL